MAKLIKLCLISFLLSVCVAQPKIEPIPVDNAFEFSAYAKDSQTVILKWKIAKNYLLYRERIQIKPINKKTKLGTILLPKGIEKHNRNIGDYQVYDGKVAIAVPIIKSPTPSIGLAVSYQGCSIDGFCYPPITKGIHPDLNGPYNQSIYGTTIETEKSIPTTQQKISELLANSRLITIILGFIGFGLLLSFTPCVLPMIPILSGIILKSKQGMTTGKAFRLSLIYVLSMSLTYAVAGVLVGYLGGTIQAALQTPWVIILFSLVFVALALSLFGFYDIKLPEKLENKLSTLSNKQQHGHYIGVAIMGVLATLIVSPCVTAPLVAVLSYIANTGNALLGGIALFSVSLGMGVPLIIIGTTGGKFLPKAGAWMNVVRAILGVLLLAVAIWMLARILPGALSMLLWATLFVVSAIYIGTTKQLSRSKWKMAWRVIGFIMLIYGVVLMLGAALGNNNPLHPLENLSFSAQYVHTPRFKRVKTLAATQAFIKSSKNPVLLDFYADWCISCKEMKHTFKQAQVAALLKHFTLIQADVTANNQHSKALLHHFNVIAPPTLLFFDRDGIELKQFRAVGEQTQSELLTLLKSALTH